MIPEGAAIDSLIFPAALCHIVDCDSSQALAVHDVRAGRNLVIQGPPGTGKSQTIANVIAAAIADGKTVLFVAEKMVALDVVKRRLDHAGVGDACLELHSNKANKKNLLEELRRTSQLGSPRGDFPTSLNASLQTTKEKLNGHPARLHKRHFYAELTPYQVIGHLTRLRQEKFSPVNLRFDQPETWSLDEHKLRAGIVDELAQRIMDIGNPANHPWHGVGLLAIIPTDVERLVQRLTMLKTRLSEMESRQTTLAKSLDLPSPTKLQEISIITGLAKRVESAPAISGTAIMSPFWESHRHEISNLIEIGLRFSRLSSELGASITPTAWVTEVKGLRAILATLPAQFSQEAFTRVVQLHTPLSKLVVEAERLTAHLGDKSELDSIATISRAIITGERVAAAPDVSADVFVASVWDQGVGQAGDIAEAVANFERIQALLKDQVIDAAWESDLSIARQTIASHGDSFFRFFRSDWRKANTLVKSFLKNPRLPLQGQIEILDNLATGQKALALIRANDHFGRSAFGADWRAERSTAAPLQALVAWMRSLRSCGAEPRLIASRLPDKSAIGECAVRTQRLIDDIRPLLQSFWVDCGLTTNEIFPDVLDVEQVVLSVLVPRIAALVESYELCINIMIKMPPQIEITLSCLKNLSVAQRLVREIDSRSELGEKVFGANWNGRNSDWDVLTTTSRWIDANHEIRSIVARHENRVQPILQATEIENDLLAFYKDIDQLFIYLCTDSTKLFHASSVGELSFASIIARFTSWVDHAEQLSKWVAYRDCADKARAIGIGSLVDEIEHNNLAPSDAIRTFDMVYYEALFADQVRQEPRLAKFDGQLHARVVEEFKALDLKRIEAASLEVAHAHHRRIPQGGGGVGPLGVLRGEMARRRGHMPIRQLMLKAAPAIQALKPVLMMSPLSVAQFLTPGQLTFDLLVMDEASQIKPVDALGAIARCRQVVVVGDERQLPPTTFFSKMTTDQDEDTDGDGAQVADIESILGLFTARGLPQRMLRWHYRSRHQSLIAVSNSQFYQNKLFIVPSPYTQEAGMGLQFHHVPSGVFSSGTGSTASGTNAVEAKIVAEAIIRHAQNSPEFSLGVATFSVAQRKAIQDQLELLRRINPDAESFFQSHPSEKFFVKSLENVQGDERDVILISVGYGRNSQGYFAMRFGPLSADGGERRLNVLISRAKRRCEVYASITDEDIDLERGKGKGVSAFKLFLHFARTGKLSIAQTSGRAPDSLFEMQVATALQACGYQVHPQVGIAGFFIDLAIADADRPGRYLLGIECDGASYHSSLSARDRDRLRQAVLEDHGWIIHRIWSTDWFQRPQNELQCVIAAIEAAKLELDAQHETRIKKSRAVPIDIVTIDRGETVEIGLVHGDNGRNVAYVEAILTRPAGALELHDTAISILVALIERIVMIEGPIHTDEIVVRLRNTWGLKRSGTRIQAAVERGIAAGIASKVLIKQANFIVTPITKNIVRNRNAVQSEGLRKPEMLPPTEIDAAILDTVQRHFGGSPDEIVQSVARLFGFKATSSQLREVIQTRIDALISQTVLIKQGNTNVIRYNSPSS